MDIHLAQWARCFAALGVTLCLTLSSAVASGEAEDQLSQPDQSEQVIRLTAFEEDADTACSPSYSCVPDGWVKGACVEETCVDIDNCCGTNGCGGGCCRTRLRWVAGVEATFLGVDDVANGTENVVQFNDFVAPAQAVFRGNAAATEDDFFFSPRIWLGCRGERWGVEATFWHLDASSGNTDLVHPGPATMSGGAALAGLETYTIDFEVTRRFRAGCWDIKASLGPRYAEFNYNTGVVSASGFLNGNYHSGYAGMSRQFDGVGLTGSLNFKRALFTTSCSRTSLFFTARAAYVWGEPEYRLVSGATVLTGTGSDIARDNTTLKIDGDNGIVIGAFQLGADFEYDLQRVPATAFFRVAAEYQVWDADSGSDVTFGTLSLASNPGVAQTTSIATMSADPQMDLIGLAASAGFNW